MTPEERQERLDRIGNMWANALRNSGFTTSEATEAMSRFTSSAASRANLLAQSRSGRDSRMLKFLREVKNTLETNLVFREGETKEAKNSLGVVVAVAYGPSFPYILSDFDYHVVDSHTCTLTVQVLWADGTGGQDDICDRYVTTLVERDAGMGATVAIESRSTERTLTEIGTGRLRRDCVRRIILKVILPNAPASQRAEPPRPAPVVRIGIPTRQTQPDGKVKEEWKLEDCEACRGKGCKECADAGRVYIAVELPTNATTQKKRPRRAIKL